MKVNVQAALDAYSRDSEGIVQPLQPKEGAAWPTPKRWKDAVKLRLEELGWNQSDLAREVTKYVETTPAAISYLFAKAKQSSLVPYIEKVIGWKQRDGVDWDSDEAVTLSEADLELPGFNTGIAIGRIAMKAALGTPEGEELLRSFNELDEPYRAQLLTEARYLVGLQRIEQQRARGYEDAIRRRDLVGDRVQRKYRDAGAVSAPRDSADQHMKKLSEREALLGERAQELRARHAQCETALAEAERKLASAKSLEAERLKAATKDRKRASSVELRKIKESAANASHGRELAAQQVHRLRAEQTRLGDEVSEAVLAHEAALKEVARESQRLKEIRDQRRDLAADGEPNHDDTSEDDS